MIRRRTSILAALIAAFVATVPSVSVSGSGDSGSMPPELQQRFRKRFGQIVVYRRQGRVGEAWDGKIAIVKPEDRGDSKLKKLVADENADRKRLFAAIADREGAETAKVAERFYQREWNRAKPDALFRGRDGTWKKRKDTSTPPR